MTQLNAQVRTNIFEGTMCEDGAMAIVCGLGDMFLDAEFYFKRIAYGRYLIQGRLQKNRQPSNKKVNEWVAAAKAMYMVRPYYAPALTPN